VRSYGALITDNALLPPGPSLHKVSSLGQSDLGVGSEIVISMSDLVIGELLWLP